MGGHRGIPLLAALLQAASAAGQSPAPEPLVVTLGPPAPASLAASLPPGFVDETVGDDWGQVTGLLCAPDGRLFVWEKAGRVFLVTDDVTQPDPVIDIAEEVGDWGDHGLLGAALDPAFATNGYIYLLYVVDHHHLAFFGTPQYSAAKSEPYRDTIGRITRYTLDGAVPLGVVPGSRRILLGADAADGFPICMSSHGVGSLVFGRDGSLLASCGTPSGPSPSGTCFSDGILQPKEDVDMFRAQLVDSLCGKIVRLDAATGDGLPSNPWFDPAEPAARRSRVWALGLRNPYSFARVPGTGSFDIGAGDPGTLLVADVGETAWEELDLVSGAGLDFGWPLFEGVDARDAAWAAPVANLDAPNPLFGGACVQPYFAFQDLIQQASLVPPPLFNPCAAGVPLPQDVPAFVHARPILTWSHAGQAVVPVWDAQGAAASAEVGASGSPAAGQSFGGHCAIGGAFVPGAGFPTPWQDRFWFADYVGGWLRALRLSPDGSVAEVAVVGQAAGNVTCVVAGEQGDAVYYSNLAEAGDTAVHRIRYVPGNLPPLASATASTTWGPAPLTVAFEASGSSDPEGGALDVAWDFGDGTFPSHQAAPSHVFPAQDVTALGSIVSRLDELVPPWSMAFGNDDPEVIRDGVVPPPGLLDFTFAYSTFHFSPQTLQIDKGGEDWLGYVFEAPQAFTGVLFVEGMQFPQGGWLDALTVQVLQADGWVEVPGVQVVPAYVGEAEPSCEAFELAFPPILGDGLRLHGLGGGKWQFFTVGELRVSALAPMPAQPVNVPVRVTVTDDLGGTDVAELTISLGNSPPQVHILQPANGETYAGLETILLEATASDAEQGGALTCTWEVILHHAGHEHPEPPADVCTAEATLQPHAGEGEVQFHELRFTSTDPLGLATSASVWLLPESDQNLNGLDDSSEVADGAPDGNGNGVPDDVETDCDADGLPDVADIVIGLLEDGDGDGIPDRCDPLVLRAQKDPPAVGPK